MTEEKDIENLGSDYIDINSIQMTENRDGMYEISIPYRFPIGKEESIRKDSALVKPLEQIPYRPSNLIDVIEKFSYLNC